MTKRESTKRGVPRKSRRARLPTSFMHGSFEFEPSDSDWERIEAAYPFLTREDREPLTVIATDYLMHAPFESRAPFLDDAMAWLHDMEKAAKVFWTASFRTTGDESKEQAAITARCLVERHIRHPLLPEGNEWFALSGIMTHVVSALKIAKRELPNEAVAGFVEGQMWDDLVCRLTDFAEERGYPVSASKGVDKSATDTPSPFIGFVRELQNTFDQEVRRHGASNMAIAEAIASARRKRKARRKIKSETAES